MLVRARVENEKFIATHTDDVSAELEYAKEMRKDPNNGWSGSRTMRKVATIPHALIKKYGETHPGFETLAFGQVKDFKLRDKAIRDFLKWEEAQRYTWGKC